MAGDDHVPIQTNNQKSAESSKADSSNPYHTHHSDHPGMILVSKTLTGDNYHGWKRAMTLALNAKNKMSFVDGTCRAPSKEQEPDSYGSWSRCNDMVHSWIINTLEPEIADSVIYYASAHEVWEDLNERFSQGNAPRVFEILEKITYLNQDQLSVSAYYTKLKGYWDELSIFSESNEGAQSEQQKLMKFLMGLNTTYAAIRNQILLQRPIPTVRQSYASVIQIEKQIQISSKTDELVAAMAVKSNLKHQNNNGGNSNSWNENKWSTGGGRWSSNDNNEGRGGRRGRGRNTGFGRGRPHCTHCNDMGHWVETCWELNGYPPNHPKAKSNQPKSANNISMIPSNADGTIAMSKVHLEQLLSMFNNQEIKSGSTSDSKANTVTKTGSGYEEDDWFG